jgi:putative alpha-1,2-mannosidase
MCHFFEVSMRNQVSQFLAGLTLMLIATGAFGQAVSGSIVGSVTDPSRASIPNADIDENASLYDEVDPFIGTAGGGLTSPAASLPFGMIQWGPTTSGGSYYRKDGTTYGFSLTHLNGVGCPVGSDVPILPWSQEPLKSPGNTYAPYVEFVQAFDHDKEEAHPGYYSVTLANGAKIELTVGDRAGIARFEFPPGMEAALLVNTGGGASTEVRMQGVPLFGREHNRNQVKLIGDNALTGTVTSWGFCVSPARYTLYVAAKFEQPYQRFDTWQDDEIQKNQRVADGKHTGAWLDFGDRRQIQPSEPGVHSRLAWVCPEYLVSFRRRMTAP